MVSGAICRDQLCIVFKRLESLKKGIKLILPVTVKCIRRTQIEYADDIDFYSNGNQCESSIQEIINKYVNLCEATRAKIQEEKVKYYC